MFKYVVVTTSVVQNAYYAQQLYLEVWLILLLIWIERWNRNEVCFNFKINSCVCVRKPICHLSLSVWIMFICRTDGTLCVKADIHQLLVDCREWILNMIITLFRMFIITAWTFCGKSLSTFNFHRPTGFLERDFESQTCSCEHHFVSRIGCSEINKYM